MALFRFFNPCTNPKFDLGHFVRVRPVTSRGRPLYLLINRLAWETLPNETRKKWVYHGQFFYIAKDELRRINPTLFGGGVAEDDISPIP